MINKLYINLLLVVIVVAPLYWLMLTEDGKRRSDLVLLWLFGAEGMDLNLKVLDSNYREQDLKEVYPDLHWQCQDRAQNRGCQASISSFNGIPAQQVTAYLKANRLETLQLVYRDQYHQQLAQQITRQLGPAELIQPEQPLLQWKSNGGLVLLKQTLQRGEIPSMMWISHHYNPAGTALDATQ